MASSEKVHRQINIICDLPSTGYLPSILKLHRVTAFFGMGQNTTVVTGSTSLPAGIPVRNWCRGLLQADCCFYIRRSAQIVTLA
jgi:hypothetical protein